jgi:hypothetical protein
VHLLELGRRAVPGKFRAIVNVTPLGSSLGELA